ncbi:MAG TPA: right-handed parallel beta-helix repeat-containing protein, partial [Caulifigura sp.]|nr:right-handed parallel beta-helix repeat-containing protein [Caulifigura sp.]
QGLHLVLVSGSEAATDVAMVQGTALSFRNCTLQSVGPGAAGSILVRVDDSARDASGAVFENCHLHSVRGDGIRLAGTSSKVFAGNSLFCFEKGSVLTTAGSHSVEAPAGREITLLRSTVVAGATAFSIIHEGKSSPSSLALQLRDSTAIAASPEAVYLDLRNWPASAESLSDKPTAVGLSWKSERSTLAGWNQFARMTTATDGPPMNFEGDAGWQKFWRQQPAGTRLASTVPELPPHFGDADSAALSNVGSHRELEPGCRVAGLSSAPVELMERVRALASSRRLPRDFIAFRKPTATVEFDLSKPGTLNAFLNDSSRVPDGSLVHLRGAGNRTIPALSIRNRVLHLEFVQAEGAPLIVRPQPGSAADAWMSIEGGAVAIANARILLPESDKQNYPPSLVKMANGSLSLTGCTFTGPGDASSRPGGLISWSAGDESHGLLIRDCYLTGGRSAVDADMHGGMLEVDNSILASVSDAIALQGFDMNRSGDVTITSSTLGGGSSIVSTGPMPASDRPALTVIINDSVALATPPATGKTSMLKLAASGDQQRIAWWEDGVGYASPQIPSVTVQDGDSPQSSWAEIWGAGHVLRVCASERAVLFESPLENLAKVEPAAFRLNPRCLSATWSATGGSLGATGSVLGASADARPSQGPEKGTARPPVPATNRPRSVF